MKKLILSALMVGAFATGANAGCSGGACSDVTIDYLLVMGSGTISVGTSGNEAGLTCSASGNKYVAISPSATGKNAMYSALLTAQTTGRKVSLRLNDDAGSCRIAYVMAKN